MTTPSSTYRLQITADFTLDDAAALTDYLHDLGVGAVYLSPVLQATVGSDHGYDTTDPTRIDRDRGGEDGLARLIAAAQTAGLGIVIDIVPNHLGISAPVENPAWWDVLRLGQESAYADWFDIDWTTEKILVPILGDDQTLSLHTSDGEDGNGSEDGTDGELRYFEHRFPLAPGSWSPGDSAEQVHSRQHYELVHHSRGNAELNYRRFFAVTTLAGVRVEDQKVLEATHAVVAGWAQNGVTGLRIDHPDGLVDPGEYLIRLRSIAPDQWITVEKILEPGETLPAAWPVAGTTGYDAMREVNGLFIDPAGEARFTELYQSLTGDRSSIGEHITRGKAMVVRELLPAELHRMSRLVPEVANAAAALGAIAVAFEVYRSYLPERSSDLDEAMERAARQHPELAETITALSPRLHDHRDELAQRLQQLSGATMAKGIEDTAYYRYSRFVALNEVGGNPDQFGIATTDFHRLQESRQATAPDSMTALSTHDTKRGEDVRARLAVLSELPDRWADFAGIFASLTSVPNRAFGYFLAQTLLGVGSIERARMHAYAEKAMREASDGTTWTAVNSAFEEAVHRAVDLAYDEPALRAAWDDFEAELTLPGRSNALSQKLVQLTMPGIPDVYQGTELWENSLVDPDNRRAVDYAARRSLLAELDRSGPVAAPVLIDDSGSAKLLVVSRALRLRRDQPELFTSYHPVFADGPAADHLVAFDRGGASPVATRLPVGLANRGGWGDTVLELDGDYRDALTGRVFGSTPLLAEILASVPVALLVRS